MTKHRMIICWVYLTLRMGYVKEKMEQFAVIVGHQAGLPLAIASCASHMLR